MIKPIGDNVIIIRDEALEKTKGGLLLPDVAKEKTQTGTVVAVGPGLFVKDRRVPLMVKPGDKVIFSKFAGTELKIGSTDYFCLHEVDILGVLDE